MTFQASLRTRTGQRKARLAAALLASAAATALATGTAEAAPECTNGYIAIEVGGRAATGDLTLSGNYGGAPETGGGSFSQAIVGFDVGIQFEGMGGTTNVQAPPLDLDDELLPPDQLPPEPEANKRKREQLGGDRDRLVERREALLANEERRRIDDPEVAEVNRQIGVIDGQLAELTESWQQVIAQEARTRTRAARMQKVPCDGPVVGVRGRLPVGGKETSRHDIHPAPSTPTSVAYDASWMLTPFIGWLLLLDCGLAPGGNVAVTPWAGYTFERGELSMTTDELGVVTSFSQNVNRNGPSIGVNVDVPLGENTFMGLGLQGDWLSSVSASGTSPSFTYAYGRERSFEYSGFARVGIRW